MEHLSVKQRAVRHARGLTAAAVLIASPAPASAEWQVKPFVGAGFAGKSTFISDFDHAAGNTHLAVGASGVLLGELAGIEADLGLTPGFFRSGDPHLVLAGRVATLTGNVVLALPRRMTQYSLRPYVVGGGGIMRVHIQDSIDVLPVSSTLRALDVGGGATGFLTDRVGVDWQLRYFRSVGGVDQHRGLSFGAEELSFWRASMALAFRY